MKKLLAVLSIFFVSCTSGCVDLVDIFNFEEVNNENLEELVVENSLSSTITITRKSSFAPGQPLKSETSSGSGVIFSQSDKYYYFLTNNHVTSLLSGYSLNMVSIEDSYGYEYFNDVEMLQSSAEYDLAIGRFPKTNSNLSLISLANSSPSKNSLVISIGQPEGVSNSITFGNVTSYTKVAVDSKSKYLSNVNFNVIKHDAYSNNGSSGGPVLNSNLELVGVNFGGVFEGDEFVCSYAIPIDKVKEFIKINDWREFFNDQPVENNTTN